MWLGRWPKAETSMTAPIPTPDPQTGDDRQMPIGGGGRLFTESKVVLKKEACNEWGGRRGERCVRHRICVCVCVDGFMP